MRVIAGKYKKNLLETPNGTNITRPTADRVKESLFNIIALNCIDSIVIDLFAGSGALGIEALSRGAKLVIFVEQSSLAISYLKKNLQKIKIPVDKYIILEVDVNLFLQNPYKYISNIYINKIELILVDPPYLSEWYNKSIININKSLLCANECLIVLEMLAKNNNIIEQCINFEKLEERIYGITKLEFWKTSCELKK